MSLYPSVFRGERSTVFGESDNGRNCDIVPGQSASKEIKLIFFVRTQKYKQHSLSTHTKTTICHDPVKINKICNQIPTLLLIKITENIFFTSYDEVGADVRILCHWFS